MTHDYLCVTWEGNGRVLDRLTFDDHLACGHVAAAFINGNPLATLDGCMRCPCCWCCWLPGSAGIGSAKKAATTAPHGVCR